MKQMVLLTVYKEVVTPVHCNIVATHDGTTTHAQILTTLHAVSLICKLLPIFQLYNETGTKLTYSDASLVSRPLPKLPIVCLTILQVMQSRATPPNKATLTLDRI